MNSLYGMLSPRSEGTSTSENQVVPSTPVLQMHKSHHFHRVFSSQLNDEPWSSPRVPEWNSFSSPALYRPLNRFQSFDHFSQTSIVTPRNQTSMSSYIMWGSQHSPSVLLAVQESQTDGLGIVPELEFENSVGDSPNNCLQSTQISTSVEQAGDNVSLESDEGGKTPDVHISAVSHGPDGERVECLLDVIDEWSKSDSQHMASNETSAGRTPLVEQSQEHSNSSNQISTSNSSNQISTQRRPRRRLIEDTSGYWRKK